MIDLLKKGTKLQMNNILFNLGDLFRDYRHKFALMIMNFEEKYLDGIRKALC